MPQQPLLLAGSVAENVAYGRDGIDETAIKAALDLVHATFVDELPEGMHTDIGAEGVFLSGGQRQRIAIARAVVHRPQLLVLDEPTNHLDRESITAVMHSIATLDPRPGVLLVSHQTEALAAVDEVLDLESGRIIARRPAP